MAKGLGRGLDAFFGEDNNETIEKVTKRTNKQEKEDNVIEKVVELNITEVEPMLNQPRKVFDKEKMEELTDSIRENGVIQPILVVKDSNGYTIVAGERRWRAAKMLNLKEVPANIIDLSDKEVLEVSLIENIQRQDLNPIEEALAYRKLIEEFNLTQKELSERIGKSRVAITNTMRLVNLDERVQQYLIESVISEGHGRVLLSIEDKDLQYELSQKIIDEKLSVRELEKLIRIMFKDKKEKKEVKVNPYIKDIEDKLQDYFSTKVNINSKNKKGKIEIEYYSDNDLNRILELMNI